MPKQNNNPMPVPVHTIRALTDQLDLAVVTRTHLVVELSPEMSALLLTALKVNELALALK